MLPFLSPTTLSGLPGRARYCGVGTKIRAPDLCVHQPIDLHGLSLSRLIRRPRGDRYLPCTRRSFRPISTAFFAPLGFYGCLRFNQTSSFSLHPIKFHGCLPTPYDRSLRSLPSPLSPFGMYGNLPPPRACYFPCTNRTSQAHTGTVLSYLALFVTFSHPDLSGHLFYALCFRSPPVCVSPCSFHVSFLFSPPQTLQKYIFVYDQ